MNGHPTERQCLRRWLQEPIVDEILHGFEWIQVRAVVEPMRIRSILKHIAVVSLLQDVHVDPFEFVQIIVAVDKHWFELIEGHPTGMSRVLSKKKLERHPTISKHCTGVQLLLRASACRS